MVEMGIHITYSLPVPAEVTVNAEGVGAHFLKNLRIEVKMSNLVFISESYLVF